MTKLTVKETIRAAVLETLYIPWMLGCALVLKVIENPTAWKRIKQVAGIAYTPVWLTLEHGPKWPLEVVKSWIPKRAKPLTPQQVKDFAESIGETIKEGNVKTLNFSATFLKEFPVEEFQRLLSERVLNDILVKEEENHITFSVAGSYTHVRPLYYGCEATDTGLTFVFPVGPTKVVDKAYKEEFEGAAKKLNLELKEEMFSLDPKLDYFD